MIYDLPHVDTTQTMSRLMDLPDDICQFILEFVKKDSYALIGLVCKKFERGFKNSEKVTKTSIYAQNPELFEIAIKHLEIHFHKDFVDRAIKRHDFPVIPIALSFGFEWDHFCVMTAAEVNSLDFFKWLINQRHLKWLPENAFSVAALEGSLEIIKFLVETKSGYPDCRALRNATGLDVIKYLKSLEEDPCYKLVKAARQDNVSVFETHFLNTKGIDDETAELYIREACFYGSLKVLEFLYDCFKVLPTIENVNHAVEFYRYEVRTWYDMKNCYE